jgi:hypothetical protein
MDAGFGPDGNEWFGVMIQRGQGPVGWSKTVGSVERPL